MSLFTEVGRFFVGLGSLSCKLLELAAIFTLWPIALVYELGRRSTRGKSSPRWRVFYAKCMVAAVFLGPFQAIFAVHYIVPVRPTGCVGSKGNR